MQLTFWSNYDTI